MKKGLQKSLALLLAVFMTFGAMPVMGITMLASAAAPVLDSIEIIPSAVTLTKVGQTMQMNVSPNWKNNDEGTFNTADVTWVSSDVAYVSVSDQGVIKGPDHDAPEIRDAIDRINELIGLSAAGDPAGLQDKAVEFERLSQVSKKLFHLSEQEGQK